MKPESTRALVGASAILILIGLLVMSPSAGFMLMVLAAILAVPPIAFGGKPTRIAGVVLLAVSLAFAASLFPSFQKEREKMVCPEGSPQARQPTLRKQEEQLGA